MELDIFSHQSHRDLLRRVLQFLHHLNPVLQIRLGAIQVETFAGNLCQTLLLHGKGSLIQVVDIQILQHMVSRKVAEQGNFVLHADVQGIFGTADDDIRLDSHPLQLLHAGLRGFGLHFLGCFQVRDQGYMDQDHIFMPLLMLKLTDGFQEGLALDVSYGSAHLNDGNLRAGSRGIAVKPAFDLIGDMRDDLNGASAEISPAFLLQDGPVDLARSHVGVAG